MIIFKKVNDIASFLNQQKQKNNTIGFVPTMGALHEGHLSLIKKSKQNKHLTVCSIFVNPTQFNDATDFEKYPSKHEEDILLLSRVDCDVLFLPVAAEIYPSGTTLEISYPLGEMENLLEGKFRPGHFQGVCQVVDRLLSIVTPHTLYMGQKDFQQCMVVEKLLQYKYNHVELAVCPTERTTSKLAMSSRNIRLSSKGMVTATAIIQGMEHAKQTLLTLPLRTIEAELTASLLASGFSKVDYVSIADANTLLPLEKWENDSKGVVLVAAFLEGVRLIDNLLL